MSIALKINTLTANSNTRSGGSNLHTPKLAGPRVSTISRGRASCVRSIGESSSYTKGENFPLIDGIYKGDIVEGVRQGYGSITWPNGDIYEGEFKDGLRDGKGTLVSGNGHKYTGEWKRSQKSGRGEELWPNGRRVYINLFI